MAKFDLKKAILENKATFFGSLTEGQFSWMTQDTGQQIGSEEENTIPVYMFDNKGKYYYENRYDGYGDFGGKDYYELLAQMNGYAKGDRMDGIDMAFGKMKTPNGGPVLFPALVTKPNEFNFKTHDFTKEAESDPNQSWYAPEEEEDFIDQNDEEEYGYDDEEEELDENKENLKESVKILDRQASLDEAYFNLDVDGTEMSFSYWDYDEKFDEATYEEVMYMIEKQLINVDKYGFPVDPQLTPEQKEEIAQVVLKDLQTNPGWKSNLKENKKEYYKDAEADDAEHIKALEKDMKDDKTSGKMKMSELKAKIKEMVLAEMESNNMEDAPEDEVDFLAELEGMLSEEDGETISKEEAKEYAESWEDDDILNDFNKTFNNQEKVTKPEFVNFFEDYIDDMSEIKYIQTAWRKLSSGEGLYEAKGDEEVTDDVTTDDVAVDDTETIDATTTTEVNPDVKAVQDSLTQAQAAAQKLGDPKLTDQIGNTITFFTRNHVVEKGAVAEAAEADETTSNNLQYVLDWWEELPFEDKKEIFHQEHEAEDAAGKYKMNESMFPMLKKILK